MIPEISLHSGLSLSPTSSCVCPLTQGGGLLLGLCGAEPVRPRPHQRERRAAAGRVCSGHRGLEDQGATPVPLQ